MRTARSSARARVHRDVTEQRQAFEAAQRLAAIVRHSNDAIIGRTLDGIITSWNQAAERMFGYSSTEMIGRSADLLTPEDRRGEVKDFVAGIRTGQHLENLETIRLRKDGTAFPVSLTISPICDTNGVVVGMSVIGRDLSEQQHAAHYARSLIEAGLDPMMTISAEGTISDVNEATVTITGVPRETLIGTGFSHYFTEPEQAEKAHRTVLAHGPATDYPLTVRHRDGTLTDVLCNASVYRDLAGNVLGVLATARDVTRTKQAFEASQRIAAIVECSNDAIIGSTLDGIITSWNPAAERLYGYAGTEIVGRSVDLVVPEGQADEISFIRAEIRAGRHVQDLETTRVRKDGTVFPVELTVAPIRDAEGAIVGASSIARDVTELRRALTTAQRLAAIVESSEDAIFGCTLDGIITSWNPAAERMYGYSSAEVIGMHAKTMTPTDRAEEMKAILGQIKAGRGVQHFETLRVRKDGATVPVSLAVSTIRDSDGVVVGTSVIHRALPELRHAAG
jgi:PAS domain S-box-containing protein